MNPLDLITAIRQNHGLEHATIHMLSRSFPFTRLVGRTTPAGFYVYGAVEVEAVANAATEALVRLQQGEAHLAVHPRCGTNLAVTGILAGAAAFGVTLGRPRSRFERLPLALTAAMLATVAAQPLAQVVQERITTTPDLAGVYIRDVQRQERGPLVSYQVLVGRD
jgi:hypothetical protein